MKNFADSRVLLLTALLFAITCAKISSLTTQSVKNIKWDDEWIQYEDGDKEIRVCPDSNVMKARYECYIYDA